MARKNRRVSGAVPLPRPEGRRGGSVPLTPNGPVRDITTPSAMPRRDYKRRGK